MNIVALIGNLASDPELRHTAQGRAVCTFRLAVSRSAKDEADFFTIVAWERQAEICAQYLQTGRRVGVEGRLHHSTWEAGDQKRHKVEIIANRVTLLGSNNDRSTDTQETQLATSTPDTSDIPF